TTSTVAVPTAIISPTTATSPRVTSRSIRFVWSIPADAASTVGHDRRGAFERRESARTPRPVGVANLAARSAMGRRTRVRVFLAMEDALLVAARANGGWRSEWRLQGKQLQCLASDPARPGRVYCGTFG